jgi:hypothetical protein
MNTVNIVQIRQAQYILASYDVRAYAVAALDSTEFVEPNHASAACLIPYERLFDEMKSPLFQNQCFVPIDRFM